MPPEIKDKGILFLMQEWFVCFINEYIQYIIYMSEKALFFMKDMCSIPSIYICIANIQNLSAVESLSLKNMPRPKT